MRINTNPEDDPLNGADVGETVSVSETVTLHTINFHPDTDLGDDRLGSLDPTAVHLSDDGDTVEVVFEGELTKTLPERWDQHNEPVTDREKRQARRKRWLSRVGSVIMVALPLLLSGTVALVVTNRVVSMLTINGQAVEPMPFFEGVLFVLLIVCLGGIIAAGVHGGLPRPGPSSRRR